MEIKRVPLQRISQQPLFSVGDIIRSKEHKHNLYRVDAIQSIQDIPYYHISAICEYRWVIPHTHVEQWQHATPEEIQERATMPLHVQKS
jgi:hypothetical protein